jgi:hypothetical protein
MIEKFYAAHVKNTLGVAAINVRRARPSRGGGEKKTPVQPDDGTAFEKGTDGPLP